MCLWSYIFIYDSMITINLGLQCNVSLELSLFIWFTNITIIYLKFLPMIYVITKIIIMYTYYVLLVSYL